MQEAWAAIPDFEGFYEASTQGHIRRTATRHVRKPTLSGKGYLAVSLSKGGRVTSHLVHRLVLRAFRGEPDPSWLFCHHKDADPTNNALANLEWVTPSENIQHTFRAGRACGERHPSAKLTDQDVEEIRRARGTMLGTQLARRFGVSPGYISNILTNRVRQVTEAINGS